MIGQKGIALTQYGHCFNAWCQAPLFVELAKFPRDALCFDCSTFEFLGWDREGWRWFDSDFGGLVILDRFDNEVKPPPPSQARKGNPFTY